MTPTFLRSRSGSLSALRISEDAAGITDTVACSYAYTEQFRIQLLAVPTPI